MAVSNAVDIAGVAALHVSPLWFFAAVSDVALGARSYLQAVAAELKKQGVIAEDASIHNLDDLLGSIQQLSGKMADRLDVPPLSIAELRRSVEELRAEAARVDLAKAIPAAEVDRLWRELEETAGREGKSLFEVSSAVAMLTVGKAALAGKGAYGSLRAGWRLADENVLRYYLGALASIHEKGYYQTVSEAFEPYLRGLQTLFAPATGTLTEEALTGRAFTRLWRRITGAFGGGATVLLVLAALAPALAEDRPASADLIARLAAAPPAERERLVHELAHAGASAIAATRQARDQAADPGLKETYARAATWQVALKVRPVLRTGLETNLTYDQQYADLKDEGPEIVGALFALAEDAATDGPERLAALRAIADVAAPRRGAGQSAAAGEGAAILSRLRRLHHDVLLPAYLKEEVRFLLAIFGDHDAVRSEIARHEKLARSQDLGESHQSHRELAQLYYRMRDYEKAVKSYEKVIGNLERELERRVNRLDPEVVLAWRKTLALEYYNAACSSSLAREIEKAKGFLRKAIAIDSSHFVNMEKDGDLANVRKDASYAAFRKEVGDLKDEL
jgi:tetratricopeptide (TPR) repeat protein